MNNSLISVLLPIGEDKRYLKEVVKSIENQTYKNIELLTADDDGAGITKTLIKLAKDAKGVYLVRMDADDISGPERLEKQANYLNNHPKVMLVGSWATLIDKNENRIGLQKMPVTWEEIKRTVFYRNPLIHPSWMMRRDWYEKIGGYNSDFKFSQDWELLLRTVGRYRIENIPEPLIKLRVHEKSISFANNKQQLWYGIKARWEAIERGDIQLWKVIYLLPKAVSFVIPTKVKYLYRFAGYRSVPGFARLPHPEAGFAMTRERGKVLGIVLPMGQNKRLLTKSGQWSLWESEIEIYKKSFAEVIIFEYRYSDWRRFLEVFLFIFNKNFKKCNALKAVHLTGAAPCLLSKIFFGKKYILSYGYRYDEFARLDRKWLQWIFFKLLTPIAVRMADAVMVPTEELKRYVERYKSKKIVVIPNGVDLKLYKGLTSWRGQTLSENKELTILFVGRLEKQKNLEMLIRAIQKLQQTLKGLSSPNGGQSLRIKMIFVGSGSLKEKLIKLAKRLNVDLEIMDLIPNDRLPEIYQQADIFVLPSLIEGHPKALLEAMACGLPCMASDISGIKEIIVDGKNGLLIKSTSGGITGGLNKLIGDRDLRERLGKEAREIVERKFDKRKLIKKEIILLQSLIRSDL